MGCRGGDRVNVELIAYTPNPDAVCNLSAGTCVSEGIPVMETSVNKYRALKGAMASGHESVVEHVSFTFAISGVSRALTHQLVRHRIGASYCVSGDTKIRTSSQIKTIKELYELPNQYKSLIKVRCVDEKTHDIRYSRPLDIVYSGAKETYFVKTIHGYEIRTTKEHMFLTESGWKALEDIQVGERVYINGQDSYKDKEWLYQKYHVENRSQKEIGDMCGVSKACIRAWVRKHGIQKPMGSWTIGVEPMNKGRTKYDYEPMRRTSEKMMGNHNDAMYRCGSDKIGSWKGDDVSESGLRSRTAREFSPKRTGVCEWCGFRGVTEFHHKNKNLHEYNFNIVELCVSCHKAVHRKEITQRIVLSEITSIEYFGVEDTYDIMMTAPNHNFIADGFVVHNSQQSQRYVNMNEFEYVTPDSIRNKVGIWWNESEGMFTTLKVYDQLMNYIQELYTEMVRAGIPEEDARYILPNATCTNIVVTMNARELMHFFAHRVCNRAQWEIRELANRMLELVKEVAPTIFANAGASCVATGRCPEKKSCGKVKKSLNERERHEIL